MFEVLLPAKFREQQRHIVLDFLRRGHEFGRNEWRQLIAALDLLKNAAVLPIVVCCLFLSSIANTSKTDSLTTLSSTYILRAMLKSLVYADGRLLLELSNRVWHKPAFRGLTYREHA